MSYYRESERPTNKELAFDYSVLILALIGFWLSILF